MSFPEDILAEKDYYNWLKKEGHPRGVVKHHMLNHYVGKQGSDLEAVFIDRKIKYNDKLTDNELDRLLDLVLLMKIDSDEELGFNWADAGSLLFFISKEDLKNKKFENTKMILDTY